MLLNLTHFFACKCATVHSQRAVKSFGRTTPGGWSPNTIRFGRSASDLALILRSSSDTLRERPNAAAT